MRVKTGTTRKAKHKKVIKLTKGFRMTKGRLYKVSHEAMMHAGEYAFAGKKKRKRDLRKTWVIRINAGARKHNLTYSKLISLLKEKKIDLNRKILSHLASREPEVFDQVIKKATG